jgi:hypothetical protein
MDLRAIGWGVWIGFDWLRLGIGGGLLWARWWTFGFLFQGVSYFRINFILITKIIVNLMLRFLTLVQT